MVRYATYFAILLLIANVFNIDFKLSMVLIARVTSLNNIVMILVISNISSMV